MQRESCQDCGVLGVHLFGRCDRCAEAVLAAHPLVSRFRARRHDENRPKEAADVPAK